MFGMTIEAEMDEAGRNAKGDKQSRSARQHVLDKYLRVDATNTRGRYADPARKVVKL